MGRRLFKYTIDLSYDKQNPYGWDAVLDGLWNRVCYTSGDWNAELQDLNYDKENNEAELSLNLDLFDEKRERV